MGDLGSIPALGRSSGEGNYNPLQYSFLENPMDRGALQATVHVVARVGQDLATKPTNQGNSVFQKVVIPQRLFIHRFCLIGQIFCDVINLS